VETEDRDQREQSVRRLAALLDQARAQRRTLTYLEVADALAIPGPKRIHKTTRLVEILLKRDAQAGRPLRAALVTSRTGSGLPGRGFFDRARRVGIYDGGDPAAFHRRLLDELFA
jgi:hypothetical protein